jgi:hypothetical protein
MPPVFMSEPARTKNGTARRGNESAPVAIFCGRTSMERAPPLNSMKTREAPARAKATGMLRAKRRRRETISSVSIKGP